MSQQWFSKPTLRNIVLASLIAPVVVGAHGGAASDDATPASTMYSIVNLWAEGGAAALLNEGGQAAFGSFLPVGQPTAYFDGDRIHPIPSLGGHYIDLRAINKHGVVAGSAEDAAEPRSGIYAFTWSLARGPLALPGNQGSAAYDINDKGQVVGLMQSAGVSARAVRWEPDGTIVPLGPLPYSLSEASAVNKDGISTGFGDLASGGIHAMAWSTAGGATDVGPLASSHAFGMHINRNGEVVGIADTPSGTETQGFYWSRATGRIPIPVSGSGSGLVADLNDRGEAVGNAYLDDLGFAYHWRRTSGVRRLPSGTPGGAYAIAINNGGEIVGAIEHRTEDGRNLHAVLWPGVGTPIDLNTRLHRVPAGLVLHSAAEINDKGVILAHSNAGLVLLRPGKRGTDAPVLGPIMGLPDSVRVGDEIPMTLGFTDNSRTETHTASAVWDDSCPSPAPSVRESDGVGQVRLQHRFCAAGYVTVRVRVTDSAGRSTDAWREVMVNAPASAALKAKGSLPRGAASATYKDVPLKFAMWSPLAKGSASVGKPFVVLHGPFHFRSDQLAAQASGGQAARVEGTGRLNGRPGYRFVVEAHDGDRRQGTVQSRDSLHVRVSHRDALSGAEVVDYDNAISGATSTLRAAKGSNGRLLEGGVTLDTDRR